MKSRLRIALALGAAIGAAGVFAGVGANAQDAAPPPAAAATAPAAPVATAPGASVPAPAARAGRQGLFSAQNRAAFFDARLAAVKAGLELTPDQQTLWDPVESAVRDMVTEMQKARQAARTQPRPTGPIDALSRAASAMSARGAAMQKLADAAQPLYASLTPDQKRRLPILMRGMGGGMGMGMRDRRMAMRTMPRPGQNGNGSRRPVGRGGYQGGGNGGTNGGQRM